MTKSEMEYFDWGLFGPLFLFLNQYFNNFFSEYLVLWFAMIWCTFDLCRYCSQVSIVRLFLLPPRKMFYLKINYLRFVLKYATISISISFEYRIHLSRSLFRKGQMWRRISATVQVRPIQVNRVAVLNHRCNENRHVVTVIKVVVITVVRHNNSIKFI